jgi:hypothetical protein
MTANFNLPPGVTLRQVNGDHTQAVCEECGAELEGSEQFIMGLCEPCLQIVKDLLPET